MRRTLSTSLLVALFIALSARAEAALIVVDWNAAGDQLIVRDTLTGLDWLKPVVTDGLTFNQVLAQTTSSGAYSGWRYAVLSEVNVLLTSGGLPIPTLNTTASNPGLYPAASAFTNLFGSTYSDSNIVFLGGRFDTGAATTNGLAHTGYLLASSQGLVGTSFCCNGRNQISTEYGSFLVRQTPVTPVPEPATLTLLGFGIGGLAARKLRSARVKPTDS